VLPTTVVSPTGIPTPIAQVASSVTVITAADIEREQRRTVPDLLSTVPGLNVVQTGGPGGQTSVFIRGTNSNQVKVLIDGIDVSDPSNANRSFDFGQLLTADIEGIEVLRGPQSGLYGADAIGGVISIITKKGEGPPRAGLVEGGSFGTLNQTASLSGAQSRLSSSRSSGTRRRRGRPRRARSSFRSLASSRWEPVPQHPGPYGSTARGHGETLIARRAELLETCGPSHCVWCTRRSRWNNSDCTRSTRWSF
jgi:outer membrane receptor protein involved in Fe transport